MCIRRVFDRSLCNGLFEEMAVLKLLGCGGRAVDLKKWLARGVVFRVYSAPDY